MGNTLCKERIERAENSKSPVDRVIGRCAQICPNSFGNNKSNSNYWNNNILETGPPTRHQPKANPNEWRTVTLNTVPKPDPYATKLSDIPIAPPRKKRNTLQRNANGQPGGFKEVFGTPSRRSSCDSVERERFNKDVSNVKRRNSSDDFTDFAKDTSIERKVSKVGNKKSDKFLGENLSDCLSNSPFLASTPILAKKSDGSSRDALETFVDSNVITQTDRSPNISNVVANEIERPKTADVNQTQSAPIQMHIQYSTKDTEQQQQQQRPSLLNAAKTTVDDYKETVENLDKRAEFLMTMVDHEFNKSQPADAMTIPKRRRSKNISNEETTPVSVDIIPATTKIEHNSEVTEQLIEAVRNGQVAADNDLKLDLSQKKKEFPKSNPDSPNIYAHLQPIEHELIVPVRKNYKHICDDDEHGHKHTHKHDHSVSVDKSSNIPSGIIEHVRVEENKIQENVSPKKPERDFSRYRKSEDLSILEEPRDESLDSIQSQIIRPERKKGRSISRDSLPSPPPRPVTLNIDRKISLQEPVRPVKSRKISLQEPMRGLFEDQKLPDTPVTPINTPILNDNEYEKIETFLKKCSSSQSFLTKELMDQLVDKVYGYSTNWDDQMEEGMLHTKCNDGSEKVGPSSKLTTRKISVIRNVPPLVNIQENIHEVKKATFLIGTSDLPIPLVKETSPSSPQSESPVTPNVSSHIKRTDTVLELLQEGVERSGQIEKIAKTENDSSPVKQMATIQTLTSTADAEISNPNLDVVKVLLKSTEIHGGSNETSAVEGIYKKNQGIMDKKINEEMMKVANNTEVKVIIDDQTDKSHSLFPDHNVDLANDSDNDSDSLSVKNKRLAIADEPRRGSIVEHDQWFLKHHDVSTIHGRRGSDCPSPYDTTKLFPFGRREKTYSESNEFFFSDDQSKKSKSSDHVNVDGTADELDHSTLLKYFHTNNTIPTTDANKSKK